LEIGNGGIGLIFEFDSAIENNRYVVFDVKIHAFSCIRND